MGKKCKSGKPDECAAAIATCMNLPGKDEDSCKAYVGGNDAKCKVCFDCAAKFSQCMKIPGKSAADCKPVAGADCQYL